MYTSSCPHEYPPCNRTFEVIVNGEAALAKKFEMHSMGSRRAKAAINMSIIACNCSHYAPADGFFTVAVSIPILHCKDAAKHLTSTLLTLTSRHFLRKNSKQSTSDDELTLRIVYAKIFSVMYQPLLEYTVTLLQN